MPYIKQIDRSIAYCAPINPGELNYTITKVVDGYLGLEPNYAKFAEAVSALECAKLELYRRLIAPYEDKKIIENGDVYERRVY